MMRLIWLMLILFSWPALPAQDLYDVDHSLAFAQYLYKSGEYRLAAEEYERVAFLKPGDLGLRLQLVAAYQRAGAFAQAQARAEATAPPLTMSPGLAALYGRILIQQDALGEARRFLRQTDSLPQAERLLLLTTTELLDQRWPQADSLLRSQPTHSGAPWDSFRTLTDEGLALKRKSPVLAIGLSTVVPGLGKAYAGYWKDGLFSLLFTGISAWQAYRGFSRNGPRNAYAWVYTGLAAGFYLGNLYGSGKAASRRNRQNQHDLRHRVERSLPSLF
ncbi:MAG: hypothetical protein D6722_25310 [Bacteroidetes bacterium]|nr:MAG: hypothetical protein D6722_25310 [Bacteroidota bacterium]